MNNLRQIALGSLNYESAHMHFPSAGMTPDSYGANEGSLWGGGLRSPFGRENLSWAYQILPMVEQENIRRIRATPGGIWTLRGFGQAIPVFSCPSRGERFNISVVDGGERRPCTDYAGFIAGWEYLQDRGLPFAEQGGQSFQFNASAEQIPEEQNLTWVGLIASAGHVQEGGANPSPVYTITNFPFIGFGAAADGSSNTFMYGEKAASALNYTTVSPDGWQAWWENSGFIHNGWPTMRSPQLLSIGGFTPDNENDPEIVSIQSSTGYRQDTGFGSPHPGTVNFVLGDGSTHAISNEMNLDVIHQAGHRSDGTIFNVTEF
jgi:hypothetical protein